MEPFTYNNRHAGAPWTGSNGHATGYHGHVHGAPILTLNELIDTGNPSNMPVHMSIVPHPHAHRAPSSRHHGHLPD